MKKEDAMKLKPFDMVIYMDKSSGKRIDVLVKRVADNGVFGFDKIQSTAALFRFEDLENY
ncbi:MAG: hypothetical protein LBI82_05695 [Dysgonamonadaceae bacterium]|nr:hypothetical protein [Dysgonamonadaceae bacterium]